MTHWKKKRITVTLQAGSVNKTTWGWGPLTVPTPDALTDALIAGHIEAFSGENIGTSLEVVLILRKDNWDICISDPELDPYEADGSEIAVTRGIETVANGSEESYRQLAMELLYDLALCYIMQIKRRFDETACEKDRARYKYFFMIKG